MMTLSSVLAELSFQILDASSLLQDCEDGSFLSGHSQALLRATFSISTLTNTLTRDRWRLQFSKL